MTIEAREEVLTHVQAQPMLPATAELGHRHLSVGQSIARGALALLSTQPLTWAASLLTVIFVPRLVGADILGQLTVAGTICTIATTLTGLGVSEFLVRRVAQKPGSMRADAGAALTIQLVTAVSGFLLVLGFGALFAQSIIEFPLLLAASLPMLVAPAQTVLLSSFRGSERHRSYAWFNASGACASTVGLVAVLWLGGDAFAAWTTAGIVSALVTLVAWRVAGVRADLSPRGYSRIAELVEFVRGGLPFMGWQITQMAYSQIDRLMLGLLVPASQVGWYAAANRIISIPIFIPTLIITPLFPALSRNAHSPEVLRRSIAETLRITLLLTVPIAAGTIVVAPAIPPLLGWPDDFLNAVLPMSILAVQLPLVAIGMVLGSVLMAIGRERRMIIVAIVAAGFNVLANLVAIPSFEHSTGNGGNGAALVTVASEVVMLFGALVFVPKRMLLPRTLWDVARIAAGGVATVFAGVALMPVALPLAVLGGAAAYIAVTFATRVLSLADLALIVRQVKRR